MSAISNNYQAPSQDLDQFTSSAFTTDTKILVSEVQGLNGLLNSKVDTSTFNSNLSTKRDITNRYFSNSIEVQSTETAQADVSLNLFRFRAVNSGENIGNAKEDDLLIESQQFGLGGVFNGMTNKFFYFDKAKGSILIDAKNSYSSENTLPTNLQHARCIMLNNRVSNVDTARSDAIYMYKPNTTQGMRGVTTGLQNNEANTLLLLNGATGEIQTRYLGHTMNFSKVVVGGTTTFDGISTDEIDDGCRLFVKIPSSTNQADEFTFNRVGRFNEDGLNTSTENGFTVGGVSSIFSGSILVGNKIWFSSDERIKENIQDIDDNEALETLRKLEPKTYNYKDYLSHSKQKKVFGFIAQQIEDVIPEAVSKQKDVIPNVMEVAEVQGKKLILPNHYSVSDISLNYFKDASDNEIANYAKIHILLKTRYDNEGVKLDNDAYIDVVDIDISQNALILQNNFDLSLCYFNETTNTHDVFIKGQVVDDFCKLNKDYVFTIATSAIQELDKIVKAQKDIIDSQQEQINTLISRLNAITSE